MTKKLLLFLLVCLIFLNIFLLYSLISFRFDSNLSTFKSLTSEFSYSKGEIKHKDNSNFQSFNTVSLQGLVYKEPFFENKDLIIPINFYVKNKKIKIFVKLDKDDGIISVLIANKGQIPETVNWKGYKPNEIFKFIKIKDPII